MSSGWVAGRTVKPTHFPDGFFGARVFEVSRRFSFEDALMASPSQPIPPRFMHLPGVGGEGAECLLAKVVSGFYTPCAHSRRQQIV
jgi:hypothetical protein